MNIFDREKEKEKETITPEDVGNLEDIMVNEIATGGNQTSGPNQITEKIRKEAVKLAESPQGLDIAAFQRKHNISVMNIDELIKGQ